MNTKLNLTTTGVLLGFWCMLEMFRSFGEQLDADCYSPATVIESATKAPAADDILKGCHYDLRLLLHVTTSGPLADNSQHYAIPIIMLVMGQAFFVPPLDVA